MVRIRKGEGGTEVTGCKEGENWEKGKGTVDTSKMTA